MSAGLGVADLVTAEQRLRIRGDAHRHGRRDDVGLEPSLEPWINVQQRVDADLRMRAQALVALGGGSQEAPQLGGELRVEVLAAGGADTLVFGGGAGVF